MASGPMGHRTEKFSVGCLIFFVSWSLRLSRGTAWADRSVRRKKNKCLYFSVFSVYIHVWSNGRCPFAVFNSCPAVFWVQLANRFA